MSVTMKTFTGESVIQGDALAGALGSALDAGGGLLKLAPNWVPRSFLHPGKRIKLHPHDWYAYGAHRGGISTRSAAKHTYFVCFHFSTTYKYEIKYIAAV